MSADTPHDALKERLERFAKYGLGAEFDMNPTMDYSTVWTVGGCFQDYMGRMSATVKEIAEESLKRISASSETKDIRKCDHGKFLYERCLECEAAPSATQRTSVPDDLWDDIYEFIRDHVDVRDGEDGPLPNRAMSLMSRIDQELP